MDLSAIPHPCQKPADLPIELYAGVGGFVNNTVIVCGSVDILEGIGACFSYDKLNDEWREEYLIYGFGWYGTSVSVSKSRMMVAGGYYNRTVHDDVKVRKRKLFKLSIKTAQVSLVLDAFKRGDRGT